eukprot:COSAG05_NODE_20609_length_278_cov_0.581006_1_plen_53_part_00
MQSPHMLNVMFVPGSGQVHTLFLGAAALHDALQAASLAACAPARQPIAQDGF